MKSKVLKLNFFLLLTIIKFFRGPNGVDLSIQKFGPGVLSLRLGQSHISSVNKAKNTEAKTVQVEKIHND